MTEETITRNDLVWVAKELAIDGITLDDEIQVRLGLNDETVAAYCERLLAGDVAPPVSVFYDGTVFWLVDGFHRVAAAKRANREMIRAEITSGSYHNASYYALGANRDNALQLSPSEKIHSVKKALRLEPYESNRSLAKHTGVSDKTVAKYRGELESIAEIPQCSTRKTSDGRQYPASRREVDDDPPPSPPSTTVKTDDQPPVVPDEPPTVVKADPPPGVTHQPPKVEDQPPSVPDLPKDRVGNPITDSTIAAIFQRDRELVELCTAVSKVKTAVLKPAEAGDPLYAGLLTGQFKADVDNVRRQIDHLRPYAICPYCWATQPKLASCNACHSQGWVNQSTYMYAPADYKQGRH